MIKAILFDHDGTLVDSESSHCDIWNRVLAPYGIVLSFDEFARDCIGVPVNETAQLLIERYQLPFQATELAAIKDAASDQFQIDTGFPALPNAMELLHEMWSKGLKIAIVSGAGRNSVMNTVARFGLAEKLDAVVTAQDVLHNKPAPEGYLRALDILGVAAQDAVAIEDSASGIGSAKAAGLQCLAIHHDFIPRQALSAADQIHQDHSAIRAALLDLL